MSIQSEIGRPEYKSTVEVKNAINPDIIKVLESQFDRAKKEAAPIAHRFKGSTRMETARNIWLALKNDIEYKKDPEGYQDIRLPRHFWNTGTGDCKSYSLNTLAIWANIYPQDDIRFKYASYNNSPVPTHVYSVVQEKNNKPIIIDGCWIFFDSEKTPTFSQKSNNMEVRVLSGTEDIVFFTPEAKAMYNKIYSSLDHAGRERFKEHLRDKIFVEVQKQQYINGEISGIEMCENLAYVESIGRIRRGKGKLGRKILHWFNAAALFLGRAAYLLFVTLNVNGLASKLAKLIEWGKFGKIENAWYIFGGNVNKFKQIIARSSKRKKLWLSHKAHVRYNEKFEGKRDKQGNPIEGCEICYADGGINIAPAVAAAALAAVPILAGLVPKLIEAFKSVPGGKGAADANEMGNQGKDLIQDVKQQGFTPSAENIEVLLPPGQRADLTAPMPQDAREQEGTGSMNLDTNIEGIGDAADVFAALTPALSSLATVGLSELGKVVSKSRNPVVRNIGQVGDATAASYGATRAGYNQDAQYLQRVHREKPKGKISLPMILGGALFAALAFKALSPAPAAAPVAR